MCKVVDNFLNVLAYGWLLFMVILVLTSCTASLFVQKGNTGTSSIKTENSASADSSKLDLQFPQK